MKQSMSQQTETWIASRSLLSGARSRDPLVRNDGDRPPSVSFLRVGLFAGLHQIEALLDLAEQPGEIAPFLRGEA